MTDLAELGARIERALSHLADLGPEAEAAGEALVRSLADLYGVGLERMLDLVGKAATGGAALEALAEDELVTGLLVLHDLHPIPLRTRVDRALESVRPYLGSHAGGVAILDVTGEGIVHLQLEGSCDGCSASTLTVKNAIETAIARVAPEVVAVEVAGMTAPGQGHAPPGPQLSRHELTAMQNGKGLLQIQPLQRS